VENAAPSSLSLLAAALYIGVALACVWAGRGHASDASVRAAARFWFLVAAVFIGMALLRAMAAEDTARDYLRAVLDQANAREWRRVMQIPLAVSLGLIAAGLLAWMAKRLRQLRERPESRLRLIAGMALVAMMGLIALRIVSLHFTDWLLFSGMIGPIRLNWIIDLGASLTVLICAILHRTHNRAFPSAGTRSVNQYRK